MLQEQQSKAGEIKFRAKLFAQQVEGVTAIADELSSPEMLAEMRRRMDLTRGDFTELAATGVLHGPFLELGAERGQRSLVLANDFGLEGYAADLSFHSLRYADFLARQEKFARVPHRVCCDAYKLPFADNSIAFAFCYQTLHHFPTPAPIFQELYRVLRPGAVLFVNEEPIRRTWKVKLWKRHVRPRGARNRYLGYAKDYLLDFVSDPHVNEVDYGIVENDEISLKEWEQAMGHVAEKKVIVKLLPIPRWMSHVDHNSSRWGLRSWLCNGLGGIFRATVMPKPAPAQRPAESAESKSPLRCPACRGTLTAQSDSLVCVSCKESYPVRDGISLLLPPEELRSLYPEAVSQAHS